MDNGEALRRRKILNGKYAKEDSAVDESKKEIIKNEKTHLESFQKAFSTLSADKNSYYLTRIVLIRFLAFIYGLLLFYNTKNSTML
jgi:hypothetical protein